VLGVDAMHFSLRLCQHAEDAERMCLHWRGECRAPYHLPDVSPMGVIVAAMGVMSRRVFRRHLEMATGEDVVLVGVEGAANGRYGLGCLDGTGRQGRECIEHCRNEHVSGNSAQRIQMDVFHCRPPRMIVGADCVAIAIPSFADRQRETGIRVAAPLRLRRETSGRRQA
jgi:hypothetical protein